MASSVYHRRTSNVKNLAVTIYHGIYAIHRALHELNPAYAKPYSYIYETLVKFPIVEQRRDQDDEARAGVVHESPRRRIELLHERQDDGGEIDAH